VPTSTDPALILYKNMIDPTKITIVMPRSNPDIDGLACAFAYSELLVRTGYPSRAWMPTISDPEAQYCIEALASLSFCDTWRTDADSRYVLVDSSDQGGLPESIDLARFVEVIDHRMFSTPDKVFPNATIQLEPVGSAATLIAERYISSGLVPSAESGILLYGAIHSNTLGLKGDVTTVRDLSAEEWVKTNVAVPSDWLSRQFEARRSFFLKDLCTSVMSESKRYALNSKMIAISQLEYSDAFLDIESGELERIFINDSNISILNIVDLKSVRSKTIFKNDVMSRRVASALGGQKEGDWILCDPAVLRKQIVKVLGASYGDD